MTLDPLIRMSRVTDLMGRHYTQSLKDGGQNPERVLRLFTDRVVADIKREPDEPPTLYHTRLPQKSED